MMPKAYFKFPQRVFFIDYLAGSPEMTQKVDYQATRYENGFRRNIHRRWWLRKKKKEIYNGSPTFR